MFKNDLNISSQLVTSKTIKFTTSYIELPQVTMSYHELVTTKEK